MVIAGMVSYLKIVEYRLYIEEQYIKGFSFACSSWWNYRLNKIHGYLL